MAAEAPPPAYGNDGAQATGPSESGNAARGSLQSALLPSHEEKADEKITDDGNPVKHDEHPSLGRKLKDMLTHSTHEQREEERHKKAEENQKREETEQKDREIRENMRVALAKAMKSGEPEFMMKAPDGKDIFIIAPGKPHPSETGSKVYEAHPDAHFLYSDQVYAKPPDQPMATMTDMLANAIVHQSYGGYGPTR